MQRNTGREGGRGCGLRGKQIRQDEAHISQLDSIEIEFALTVSNIAQGPGWQDSDGFYVIPGTVYNSTSGVWWSAASTTVSSTALEVQSRRLSSRHERHNRKQIEECSITRGLVGR